MFMLIFFQERNVWKDPEGPMKSPVVRWLIRGILSKEVVIGPSLNCCSRMPVPFYLPGLTQRDVSPGTTVYTGVGAFAHLT